jgi:pimeloyl-ACP methyl ester carboxylesterase
MATYVLVHGAWHSGRVWERVAPLLTAAGHRVLAPSLTGYGDRVDLLGAEVGIETHTDDVAGLIVAGEFTDVILLGHSYAGLVISSVASRIPERVGHLVYLDAMVPVDGENAVDIMPISQGLVDAALSSESGWRIPPLPQMPPPFGLFGVTEPADVEWLQAMLSDQPVQCLLQRVRLDHAALATIPRTHIHCTVVPEGFDRRPVPPRQPNGSPSVVWELPTGHDCMLTMPGELAELLLILG